MAETTWLETFIHKDAQIKELIDLFPDGIVLIGEDLQIIGANRSAVSLLDFPLIAFKEGTPVKEFFVRLARNCDFATLEVKQVMHNALAALATPEKVTSLGNFTVNQGPVTWWVAPGPGDCAVLMFRNASGAMADSPEQKQTREEVTQADSDIRPFLDKCPMGVAISDRKTSAFLFYNACFSDLFGADYVTRADFKDTVLISERFRTRMLEELQSEHIIKNSELRIKIGDQSLRWFLTTIEEVCFEGRDAILWWISDITEQKQLAQELKAKATMDDLTGLANRTKFSQRLERAERMIMGTDKVGAVMLLDLDGFKAASDTLGYEGADFVLKEVAERLKRIVRGADVVARFGGDEFAILYTSKASTAKLTELAQSILQAIEEPMMWEDQPVKVSASIGIKLFDGSITDGYEELRKAETAIYDAKQAGKGQFRFV